VEDAKIPGDNMGVSSRKNHSRRENSKTLKGLENGAKGLKEVVPSQDGDGQHHGGEQSTVTQYDFHLGRITVDLRKSQELRGQ
jgi:hypothetical protein